MLVLGRLDAAAQLVRGLEQRRCVRAVAVAVPRHRAGASAYPHPRPDGESLLRSAAALRVTQQLGALLNRADDCGDRWPKIIGVTQCAAHSLSRPRDRRPIGSVLRSRPAGIVLGRQHGEVTGSLRTAQMATEVMETAERRERSANQGAPIESAVLPVGQSPGASAPGLFRVLPTVCPLTECGPAVRQHPRP